MKVKVVSVQRASLRDRWSMFLLAMKASKELGWRKKLRLRRMAAVYSLSPNCKACFYEVKR